MPEIDLKQMREDIFFALFVETADWSEYDEEHLLRNGCLVVPKSLLRDKGYMIRNADESASEDDDA